MKLYTHNHVDIPALGFGTWQLRGAECSSCVDLALSEGYRHIDTAQIYENEEEVGFAVSRSNVPRSDVFITTKIWMDNLRDEDVRSSLEVSLKKLKTDYVDLLLVHWPVEAIPLEETMRAFEDVQQLGKTRLIGVSNFTVEQMKEVTDDLGVDIATNQVEYHPTLSQDLVLEFIHEKEMFLTAYSPLGRGKDLEAPVIQEAAEAHNKTPGQIVLRWLVQQDRVAAIPKSANHERIKQNLDIFDFELTKDEMHRIARLAHEGGRLIDPEWAPEWNQVKKAG